MEGGTLSSPRLRHRGPRPRGGAWLLAQEAPGESKSHTVVRRPTGAGEAEPPLHTHTMSALWLQSEGEGRSGTAKEMLALEAR